MQARGLFRTMPTDLTPRRSLRPFPVPWLSWALGHAESSGGCACNTDHSSASWQGPWTSLLALYSDLPMTITSSPLTLGPLQKQA